MSERFTPAYKLLASSIDAYKRCKENPAQYGDWLDKHEAVIRQTVANHFPSGSGVDNGTHFDFDASSGEKLVFRADFHHMNENGFYDGWTTHVVTVRPSFVGDFDIRISGVNRNQIKDYLAEIFDTSLRAQISDSTQIAYQNCA